MWDVAEKMGVEKQYFNLYIHLGRKYYKVMIYMHFLIINGFADYFCSSVIFLILKMQHKKIIERMKKESLS